MHYLITGGTGFIGGALCRRLLADGDRLSVLTRQRSHAESVLPDAVRAVESLDEIDGAIDGIVNLAGENLFAGRWTAARKRRFHDSRIQTTRALVDWIARQEAPPKVLVSGSAIGYYGVRGDETLTEASGPGTRLQGDLDLCADWEAEAARAEHEGLRVCRLRTGLVLHPDGGALKQMLLPFKLGFGGRVGDGLQWWSWIHRADLVAMIVWLLRSDGARGPYNGTAPQPVRNAEFAQTLADVLHRPALLPLPAPLLKLALGDMSELLTTGQKVLPQKAIDEGFAYSHPVLEPALRELLDR